MAWSRKMQKKLILGGETGIRATQTSPLRLSRNHRDYLLWCESVDTFFNVRSYQVKHEVCAGLPWCSLFCAWYESYPNTSPPCMRVHTELPHALERHSESLTASSRSREVCPAEDARASQGRPSRGSCAYLVHPHPSLHDRTRSHHRVQLQNIRVKLGRLSRRRDGGT